MRKIQDINLKRLEKENSEVIKYNRSKFSGWDTFNFIFALIILVVNYFTIIYNGVSLVKFRDIDKND